VVANRVPSILKERLGDEATLGLLDFVDAECNAWSGRVLTTAAQRLDAAAERYDTKLDEIGRRFGAKFDEIERRFDEIERRFDELGRRFDARFDEIERRFDTKLDSKLAMAAERYERRLAEEVAGLRVAVVREIHEGRVDSIKWSFLFWLGQVAAIFGLFSLMLRSTTH